MILPTKWILNTCQKDTPPLIVQVLLYLHSFRQSPKINGATFSLTMQIDLEVQPKLVSSSTPSTLSQTWSLFHFSQVLFGKYLPLQGRILSKKRKTLSLMISRIILEKEITVDDPIAMTLICLLINTHKTILWDLEVCQEMRLQTTFSLMKIVRDRCFIIQQGINLMLLVGQVRL